MRLLSSVLVLAFAVASCGGSNDQSSSTPAPTPSPSPAPAPSPAPGPAPTPAPNGAPFAMAEEASFAEPWAMTFLPDGTALVTEKAGKLKHWKGSDDVEDVAGVPQVAYGGQGGFADVVLAPDYDRTGDIYLSWAEDRPNDQYGGVVVRAHLDLDTAQPRITNIRRIWEQHATDGQGQYSLRILFSRDGRYLFITSGEKQAKTPAQDLRNNLGTVVRLFADGSVPPDNPYADRGGETAQIWSYGHRNLYGLFFDKDDRLWETEMGPQGGDEVNLILPKHNYGWPLVSNGDNYDGSPIPDHDTRPDLEAPKVWWNPSISPAGGIIYSGALFPQWQGSMFIGALSGEALIRVALSGDQARKGDQWNFGFRIREVEQGPHGAIWLLEDGDPGRMLKLTPKS